MAKPLAVQLLKCRMKSYWRPHGNDLATQATGAWVADFIRAPKR